MESISVINNSADDPFFDSLKGWMSPQEVADKFGFSIWTIYKWKNRGALAGVPTGLFIKFNRKLYIRTEILRRWISSQNPHGESSMRF